MEEALKLIISRSPNAAREAMQTIAAINAKSPMVSHRYNRTVDIALNDPQAEFSSEERALLAGNLAVFDDVIKTETIRFRATQAERAQLEELANSAGMNMSDYIRNKIFEY